MFSDSAGDDLGLRLIDLNNDGYVDVIKGRQSNQVKKAWINNKTALNETSEFVLPEYFVYNQPATVDSGLRIADLNNDGLVDLIQGRGGVKRAWLNNGSGWKEDTLTWAPPIEFLSFVDPVYVDKGAQLVDFNGDGKVDLLQATDLGLVRTAYINTGSGWKNASPWESPTYFTTGDGSDHGTRLVDLNGDGLIDIIQGYDFTAEGETKAAWLNNGSGWVNSTNWIPPDVFTTTSIPDRGVRFVDLNGDGLVDIVFDYKNGSASEREAFINTGNGWSNSTSWLTPEPFTKNGKNIGRRIGDIDGDGFADILVSTVEGSTRVNRTVIRNSTIPYLLKNITNEFGGIT